MDYHLCLMICALVFFPCSASLAEVIVDKTAEPQRLSVRGESELRGIVAAGRLETL